MFSSRGSHFRPFGRLLPLLAVVFLLAACGGGGSGDPTPEPTQPPAPTAAPGALTMDDLVARIEQAWPSVTSMRMTSTSGPIPTDNADTTPVASGESSIEEAIAPNSRRVVKLLDGQPTDEQIWVNGKVYMAGQFVAAAVAPEVPAGSWITVDPAVVPADTPVGMQIAYLTRPLAMPLAAITPDLRARPVTEAGQVQVGDRTCTVYTLADRSQVGDRIDYELALDANNLPCQWVRRSIGIQDSTVFEINVPGLTITAPDTPTPVSGTPEG